ncbi:iron ABC transporter permease [Rhodoblastus acidophilus]|uniref:Iron ABC transporter permease n=1 Tax=Candidatus Rhodoblastus alkanivorans TaxID=2954117 RepID=A0ABS9Z6L7_9HYPH|nr:iron ABC transporter permease [Candidatus Rhodoblastus alkanivorans]MCI4678635.1 iron ABC transporter permease [Candidatus Rhodoblastus alkanivorans]MCI4683045.1 iron ABC transporter permease [Candidatus Rhodoblastus alkanivorans]MDI4640355.1 iron ABC transporter permease [Rhodoblastus acidophilus]
MSNASCAEATVARRRSTPGVLSLLSALLVFAVLGALTLGRYPVSLRDIFEFLGVRLHLATLAPHRDDLLRNVILEVRAPRVLSAALIGAAMSVAGASYQSVFRNPLASPAMLGALGGASFGAALGLLLGVGWAAVQGISFVFGVAAVTLGVGVANAFGAASTITLILGGMISGAFFTALLSILKYLADPYDQLPSIVYWLMGSLSGVTLSQAMIAAPAILAGILVLVALARPMDALAMGEDEARSLGVPVGAVRYGAIAAATLITALGVSLAGMIGWIGLFAPHLARILVGPHNSVLVPAAALIGAIFLIGADSLARSMGRAEIPVGIVTELIGIPAFLLVLRRSRRGWT